MNLSIEWWNKQEDQWKKAFGLLIFHHFNTPSLEELKILSELKVLRIVGPTGAYPSVDFELTNLKGVAQLVNLEILTVTHHKIDSITPLINLTNLKALFLLNNEITSLEGINKLHNIEQLYVQFNRINSILPISSLLNLKVFFIHNNNLTSLEGVQEFHTNKLKRFYCLPNEQLSQKEIIRVERNLGVLCKSV